MCGPERRIPVGKARNHLSSPLNNQHPLPQLCRLWNLDQKEVRQVTWPKLQETKKKKKGRICQLWVWNFKGRHEKHALGHLETWTTCRAEELALLEGLVCATCYSRRVTQHTSSHWILRMIPCVREHSPKESDEENKGQGGWVTCLRLYEGWVIDQGSDPEYCGPMVDVLPTTLSYLGKCTSPSLDWPRDRWGKGSKMIFLERGNHWQCLQTYLICFSAPQKQQLLDSL